MRALHVVLCRGVLALGLLAAVAPARADDPAPAPSPPPVKEPPPAGEPPAEPVDAGMEAAREAKLKQLRRELRKWAQGPYAAAHRDDILKILDALATLGGVDAAKAALEVVSFEDKEARDKAFALVEKVHDKALIGPLAALIEHKDFRRDWDLHKRIAHAFAVTADVSAIEPLVTLIASEDEHVVAEAADALGTFGEAKVDQKREAVQRMIDLYESTWNLMNSVRPEDQKAAKIANEKWEVFSGSLRRALQALTLQQISRPKDWRRWWNDHKKDAKWAPGTAPVETGSPR
jgi:hypothetical protein